MNIIKEELGFEENLKKRLEFICEFSKVENNHEFIRDIILKKKSMLNLTQDKLDLMFSHINSVPRKSLGGMTPYEAFEFFYGKDTLDKFNIQKIKEDEVTLQPYLLQL